MDKHVLQTTELRGKKKKYFSAVNGTKMGAEKAFHTQDPTVNWRSDVQVTALATTLTGSCHNTGPKNFSITASRMCVHGPPPAVSKWQPPAATDRAHAMQYYNVSG